MRSRLAIAVCAIVGAASACATQTTPSSSPPVVAEPTPAPAEQPALAPEAEEAIVPEAETPDSSQEEAPPAEEPTAQVEIPDISDKLIERVMKQQERVAVYAAKHEVDPDLVNAVIWVESKFDPRAKGPAGAMGLMQLMPRTAGSLAKRLGRRSRPYDPDFALDAGCLYIHRIMKRFDGDLRLSLAAYNRGVGKVKSWVEAGEPLPERTAAYVNRVLEAKAWLPLLIARETGDSAPEPEPAVSALEWPRPRAMLNP